MLYQQTIPANGSLQMPITGRLFLLDSTGAAASVDISLLRNGSPFFSAPGMVRGLRLFAQNAPFDGVRIEGAAGAVVRFIIADEDVQISTSNGASVAIPGGVQVTNAVGSPVPVNVVAGSIVISAVTISNVNGPATQGRASITNANALLIAADAARRWLLVQNNDAAAVLRVTVDGSNASATAGFRIQPGTGLEVPQFCVTGSIHVCMETATAAAANVEFVSA